MGATFTHTAAPLPPDIRVMNGVAGLLLAAFALAAAAVGLHWLARQPAFSIRSITVEGAGAAFSPALGGWIAQTIGFPPAFLVLGGFGIAAVMVWIVLGAAVKQY